MNRAHDHGPDEGPGTACVESLQGACRVLAQKVHVSQLRRAARAAARAEADAHRRMELAEAKVQAVRQLLYDDSPFGEAINSGKLKWIIDPGNAVV